MTLELLPAVDVQDGQAVRLVQGEAGSETAYGDPLAAALNWQEQGASWVHLVDLDAAFGRGSNHELLADVVGRLDIDVELSGGIRDNDTLSAALATGCRRINIGTAALENPDWCARVIAEHGDKVAIGLDVRGTTLAARGWTQEGGELFATIERLNGEIKRRTNVVGIFQWRRVVPGGYSRSCRACSTRRRGLDHRQGAVRRRLHASRSSGSRSTPHRLHEPAVQRA